jgi:hypothetical protein
MSDKLSIKTVDKKSTTSIVISGSFMQRIQSIYFEYLEKLGKDKNEEIFKHLKEDTIKDISDNQLKTDAYNVQTLLTLIVEIENSFKDDKLIEDTELDIPSED